MSLLARIGSLPGVHAYRKWSYRRRFERERYANLFFGVFPTFDDAIREAPRHRSIGYDNPGAATLYAAHVENVRFQHYPLLFWLGRIWPGVGRVLDFGGHRGSLYYAARQLLGPGPEWVVYDVPAVVEEAKRSARWPESELRFTSDLTDVGAVDTVIAAGSLQYVQESAAGLLARVGGRPRHVLLNAVPFHPRRRFVTLNNIGPAFCPYLVRKSGELFDELRELGFQETATWSHDGKSCEVPFHVPAGEVVYRGGYFTR